MKMSMTIHFVKYVQSELSLLLRGADTHTSMQQPTATFETTHSFSFKTMHIASSSQLLHYHHLFHKSTHLQQTTVHRQKLTKRGSASVITRTSISSDLHPLHSKCSLAFLDPLQAILFDIDGTLCDSDPLHYYAFREMLQEVGFNGGIPITEEFFIESISGMHNEELCGVLFPDWDIQRARKFFEDKEDMFRRLASKELEPMKGLHKLKEWIENQGLKRAAVTNAPRPNGELLVSALDLLSFFEVLVIANECDRAKPFPDPYLKALQVLDVSPKHAFVFEDSVSGVKAGVAAGMLVVGLGTRNPERLLVDAGASFVIKDFGDPKLWESLEELERRAQKL